MRGGVFQLHFAACAWKKVMPETVKNQVLNALRLLESRALKQVEKSTAQKQPRISNFFSPAV